MVEFHGDGGDSRTLHLKILYNSLTAVIGSQPMLESNLLERSITD